MCWKRRGWRKKSWKRILSNGEGSGEISDRPGENLPFGRCSSSRWEGNDWEDGRKKLRNLPGWWWWWTMIPLIYPLCSDSFPAAFPTDPLFFCPMLCSPEVVLHRLLPPPKRKEAGGAPAPALSFSLFPPPPLSVLYPPPRNYYFLSPSSLILPFFPQISWLFSASVASASSG